MEITNKRIRHLVYERPEWLPIIEECLTVAKTVYSEFAGAWVYQRLLDKGLPGFSNLRMLVRNEILQTTHTTRGGKRAYYIFTDLEGAEETVRSLRAGK